MLSAAWPGESTVLLSEIVIVETCTDAPQPAEHTGYLLRMGAFKQGMSRLGLGLMQTVRQERMALRIEHPPCRVEPMYCVCGSQSSCQLPTSGLVKGQFSSKEQR
jgi:hypothetical protein